MRYAEGSEKPTLLRIGGATPAAVDKDDRLALRVTRLFKVDLVEIRHAQDAGVR
jgi:hypothetical protein